jgi:hypothetical protein
LVLEVGGLLSHGAIVARDAEPTLGAGCGDSRVEAGSRQHALDELARAGIVVYHEDRRSRQVARCAKHSPPETRSSIVA